MFKTVSYQSEDFDGIQFEISSLVNENGEFFGTSFNCINYPNSDGGISYDFSWDNPHWLLTEFYPVLKEAVEKNVNLYDIKPEWFDDHDVEEEGEPEMLKDESVYGDLLEMFESAIKDGMFNIKS
jgi:hypothetical protein